MDQNYEQKYHELEDSHWWFKGRREAVLTFFNDLPKDSKILDVGCSSGHLLKDLEERGFEKNQLYGIDVSESGVALARELGFKNTSVMDGSELTFEDDQFDVIVSSDSLEHMEFDERALSHWYRVLKPGGTLIVFVPAFMQLWSAHDEVNHHYRRYTKSSLSEKVAGAGFDIRKSGYWNSLLFPPIAAVRMLGNALSSSSEDEQPEDDLRLPSPLINTVLLNLIRFENKLLNASAFPFGVSTFCIAQK